MMIALVLFAVNVSAQEKENSKVTFQDYLQLEEEYVELCKLDSTLVGYRFVIRKLTDTTYSHVDAFNSAYSFKMMGKGFIELIYVNQSVTFSKNAYWSFLKDNLRTALPEWPLTTLEIKVPQTPTFEGFYKWRIKNNKQ